MSARQVPREWGGRAAVEGPPTRTQHPRNDANHDDTDNNTCTAREGQSAEWRPVPHYVGLYEAGRHGVIRSLERWVETADGRTAHLRGVELVPVVDRRSGVMAVSLSRHGRRRTRRVAELVLAAFGDPQPYPWAALRHLDGDKSNCALENLAWITARAEVAA